ncbi:hypothetical protein ACGF07_20955 [Kitasatospora sp. NPDC048194]|uniref:hypothetical protein n=1 Tax=Kitasatospora sp. NPDC048194 TaxID=3364045 RepID=UPI00371C165E
MKGEGAWNTGPAGEAMMAGDGDLLSLLRRAAVPEQHGRMVITPLVCRSCDWDRFELTTDEYFCEGCCLPLGIADGNVYAGGSSWELAGGAPSRSWLTRAFRKPADITCPTGHDVFQAAAAFALAEDGQVRRLSVGLRCPVDGALRLHLDNVRVVPSGT